MHQQKILSKRFHSYLFSHYYVYYDVLLSRLYNLAGFIQKKVYIKGTNLHRASLIVHLHSCA
jgi:hypothetical protein